MAQAHGANDPAATSYLARLHSAPRGVHPIVVDGDLRLWLRVPPHDTAVVLDYRGAPYLRFSAAGVSVNENSEMFYFNQTPSATPPGGLRRTTPPRWSLVSRGHSYEWHDARLGALSAVVLDPGAAYVGPWRIPLVVNGQATAISGTLWYRGAPSIVWFWPIAVLIACVLAAWRLEDRRLHLRLARVLSGLVLSAVVVGGIGRELHGRPGLSGFSLLVLAALLVVVAFCALRLSRGRAGFPTYLIVAALGAWVGLVLVPVLLHGYVLLAIPAFLARAVDVVCLGASAALIPLAWRLGESRARSAPAQQPPKPLVGTAA